MKIGIDKIGFYAPHLYVDMNDLAKARGVEPAKFTIGIGQDEMALAPLTQDPVTLAANAALNIIDDKDREQIDLVLFATETGIDNSKSAGIYVHQLVGLKPEARTVELKQACYSATAAIQFAKGHIALSPSSKVLILASDIARYGINTPGEVTQGAGAVAIIMGSDPRVLEIEAESTYYTEDIMDFWRPTYSDTAYVDGAYSNEQYIKFFNKVWQDYKELTAATIDDFSAFSFHIPYTKMGLKALQTILDEASEEKQAALTKNYQDGIVYNRKIGNIYTASLYLSLISLLENSDSLSANDRVALFSYGSGAVGEFFTAKIQPNYKNFIYTNQHQDLLADRKKVSIEEYEAIFTEKLPVDGSTVNLDVAVDPAPICLSGVSEHQRQYVNKNN